MNILAIDTATEACSVALESAGEVIMRYQVTRQQHAQLLLPMIDELLAEANLTTQALDVLVMGRGPGSFTGLRITAAAVQAIALVADCPVVRISSLAAMAHRAWREHALNYCVALIDARMNQVYWACFETTHAGASHALTREQVSDPEQVSLHVLPSGLQQKSWAGVGTGAIAYRQQLQSYADANKVTLPVSDEVTEQTVLPHAYDMLLLSKSELAAGNTVGAADAIPVYLRDKVALTEREQRRLRN